MKYNLSEPTAPDFKCFCVYIPSYRTADKAVDGDDNPDIYRSMCAHTRRDSPPWFVVDFKQQFNVIGVAIVNRRDQGSSMYKGFFTS